MTIVYRRYHTLAQPLTNPNLTHFSTIPLAVPPEYDAPASKPLCLRKHAYSLGLCCWVSTYVNAARSSARCEREGWAEAQRSSNQLKR